MTQRTSNRWLAIGFLNSLIIAGTSFVVLVAIPLVTDVGDDPARWLVATFAVLLLMGQTAKLTHSALAPAFTACVLGVAVLWILAAVAYAIYAMAGWQPPVVAFLPGLVTVSYLVASAIVDLRVAAVWHRRAVDAAADDHYLPTDPV